mmetsp:Transcript_7511/g.16182  ORF Transcript_7511/g.16182 Transcript_7511/m.16182 type:complete len:133 (+) Transcript_7511:96-494(+)
MLSLFATIVGKTIAQPMEINISPSTARDGLSIRESDFVGCNIHKTYHIMSSTKDNISRNYTPLRYPMSSFSIVENLIKIPDCRQIESIQIKLNRTLGGFFYMACTVSSVQSHYVPTTLSPIKSVNYVMLGGR